MRLRQYSKVTVSTLNVVMGLLVVHPAMAETNTASDQFSLGEVTVTARKLDNSMIGGAEVEQETLRTFGKATVDQALDLVPGAVASNTGGSRNERLIYVRGFDRFQTTLSIDGVRVFLPADNRIDFARFLTADLSKIQISKGYVSVLDGPGGLGGAINLVTRRPSAPLEAEVVTTGSFDGDGTNNGYTVSGRVGTRQELFYVQVSGAKTDQDHWRLSDDFTPTVLENGGKRDHSDSNDYRVNLKAGFTPNATDEYALNYTKQGGEKNAPYHVTDTASTRYWAWPYWDIDSLYFLSNTQFGEKTYLRTRVYVNTFDNALYSYDSAAQTTQLIPRAFRSYYEDTAYGARVELGTSLFDANTLRTSFNYRNDRHDEWQEGFLTATLPYTEPKQVTKEDTYSVALEDTQKLGANLDVVAGVSYDWTDLRRAEDVNAVNVGGVATFLPVNYPLRNTHAWNYQGAVNYQLNDATQLHASISSRTRFPTLFERFSARMGTAVPNPDIAPERATNYEVGGKIDIGVDTHVEGAVFYSDVSDALISVPVVFGAPINATLSQTRNVGDGQYYGGEVSADTRLNDALKLGGNYTYLQRKLTDPTNAAFRPTGVPTHKAFAYADWNVISSLTLTPSVEWDSSRWTVTSSSAIVPSRYYRTGSFTLVNFVASYALNQHFDALLGGRNLLDRNYQLVDGFPEQGRNFYASLRARY
ncbi:MAG: TonB-dependent receptor [Steroidobacteraceae bacterium]